MTVVKDSAGRYFASFVVQSGPEEVRAPVEPEVGIDLGLGHFAVLSDGRKAMAAPMPWETSHTPTTITHITRPTTAGDSGTVTVLCSGSCHE